MLPSRGVGSSKDILKPVPQSKFVAVSALALAVVSTPTGDPEAIPGFADEGVVSTDVFSFPTPSFLTSSCRKGQSDNTSSTQLVFVVVLLMIVHHLP